VTVLADHLYRAAFTKASQKSVSRYFIQARSRAISFNGVGFPRSAKIAINFIARTTELIISIYVTALHDY
jgi:hypothetical protein